jgi:DNA-binding transcriptional LysR family regulator
MDALTEMSWDDLRYFLFAARAKTLAGAARYAGVQHTTIGRRLTALERSLGAPLFLRGPEGLSLTPLGENLLPLVLDVERGVLAVRELAASRRARVRVALPSGFVAFFADDLARFSREHPGLTLEIVSGSRLLDLKRGEADLAVRSAPILDEELVARSLADMGFSLYASPAYLERHPMSADWQTLAGHDVIAYGAALVSLPPAQWLAARAADATIVLSADEIATMLDAAASGVGIALLPCAIADIEPRLVRLTPDVLARQSLSLVYRRESRTNESVRATANFLVAALRARAGQPGAAKQRD